MIETRYCPTCGRHYTVDRDWLSAHWPYAKYCLDCRMRIMEAPVKPGWRSHTYWREVFSKKRLNK